MPRTDTDHDREPKRFSPVSSAQHSPPTVDVRTNKRYRRRLRIGIGVLVLIFLIGSFINFLFSAGRIGVSTNFITTQFQTKRFVASHLNSDYRENVIYMVVTDKLQLVRLLSYDPVSENLTLISIPVDTYINVANRPVTRLMDWSVAGGGYDQLLLQLQDLLALPLDGVIVSDDPSVTLTQDQVEQIRKQSGFAVGKLPAVVTFLKSRIKTNLTAWECLTLVNRLRSVRSDRIASYSLEGYDFELKLEKQTVLAFDTVKLDGLLHKIVPENTVLVEPVTVEVRNATSISGIGNQVSRYLANQGAQVVSVGNTPVPAKSSMLYTFEKRDMLTKRIEFFHIPESRADTTTMNLQTRGDLLLIVGQDYIDLFYPPRPTLSPR